MGQGGPFNPRRRVMRGPGRAFEERSKLKRACLMIVPFGCVYHVALPPSKKKKKAVDQRSIVARLVSSDSRWPVLQILGFIQAAATLPWPLLHPTKWRKQSQASGMCCMYCNCQERPRDPKRGSRGRSRLQTEHMDTGDPRTLDTQESKSPHFPFRLRRCDPL